MENQLFNFQELENQLGVVGTIQFLKRFDNGGKGDYTAEKYEKEDVELTEDEILQLFS